MSTTELLAALVAFPTVSRDSNLALLDWLEAQLAPLSPRLRRFPSTCGTKANLLASIGPDVPGGLLLSGHTDVVPTDGQAWLADPFVLRDLGGRLTGRGACDMKGFLACCLHAAPALASLPLRRPVHLAFSYDEELGCTGVGPMAEWAGVHLSPALAVIGEPSLMQVVNAHKGGMIGWVTVTGRPGHSSQPNLCVNAVMIAAECIARFNRLNESFHAGPHDSAFDPPYSTTQVNRVEGGNGGNIVAETCRFFWEMRVLPGVDDHAMLAGVERQIAAELVSAMQAIDPVCGVRFDVQARIPALAANDPTFDARLLRVLGKERALAVPYGSEAGIFQRVGMPAVILGPGSIAQAHQPEEWMEASQLDACVTALGTLTREHCT